MSRRVKPSAPEVHEQAPMDRRSAIKRTAAALALGASLGVPIQLKASDDLDDPGTLMAGYIKIDGIDGESGVSVFQLSGQIPTRGLDRLKAGSGRVFLKWYVSHDGRGWEMMDQTSLSDRVSKRLLD